jgi:hypothetical protein
MCRICAATLLEQPLTLRHCPKCSTPTTSAMRVLDE